jgi:hypothetical protein
LKNWLAIIELEKGKKKRAASSSVEPTDSAVEDEKEEEEKTKQNLKRRTFKEIRPFRLTNNPCDIVIQIKAHTCIHPSYTRRAKRERERESSRSSSRRIIVAPAASS